MSQSTYIPFWCTGSPVSRADLWQNLHSTEMLSVWLVITQCHSMSLNVIHCHLISLYVTQCHLPAWWAAGDTCVRLFEDGGPPGELVQVGSVDLAKEWGHHMQSWNLKQRVFLHIMWKRIKRTYLFFVSLYTPNAKFFFKPVFYTFNQEKDHITDFDAFTLFYCEWKLSWFARFCL